MCNSLDQNNEKMRRHQPMGLVDKPHNRWIRSAINHKEKIEFFRCALDFGNIDKQEVIGVCAELFLLTIAASNIRRPAYCRIFRGSRSKYLEKALIVACGECKQSSRDVYIYQGTSSEIAAFLLFTPFNAAAKRSLRRWAPDGHWGLYRISVNLALPDRSRISMATWLPTIP